MTATARAAIHLSPVAPLPAPSAPRSPYHLTEEQVQFFDRHGYLVLRRWVTGELLGRLQRAGEAWIGLGHRPDLKPDLLKDFTFAKRDNGDVMFRVNYLHNKQQPASLELLGSPQVLGVAEALCGQNFVPTYESMVFKQRGDGEAIPWHQDAAHPRRYRIFNFDLYLDPSQIGAGALRVVPGSQVRVQDACKVRESGWDQPGAIDVPMEPGDVLLHDVMILHGSDRVEGKALRRTIYYEFRSAEQIRSEGPWDAAWVDKRMRLIPLALNAFQQQFPDLEGFAWRADPEFRPAPLENQDAELRVVHEVHTPGSWCSAGDALPTA